MECTSCNKKMGMQGVVFKCPVCSQEIARCGACKGISASYKCRCGFEGP